MLILKDQYLDDENWWSSNYKNHFSYLDKYFDICENYRQKSKKKSYQTISNDLVQFLIIGLYLSSFSIMESRFRLFYNYFINPEEKGQIKRLGSIGKISEKLLDHLNFCQKYICLELFMNIRNTIHN